MDFEEIALGYYSTAFQCEIDDQPAGGDTLVVFADAVGTGTEEKLA